MYFKRYCETCSGGGINRSIHPPDYCATCDGSGYEVLMLRQYVTWRLWQMKQFILMVLDRE